MYDIFGVILGYLKICVSVCGPGDESPTFGSSASSDDIESNLLWPTGVTLEPAFFSIELYHLQDLPRSKLPLFISKPISLATKKKKH